MAPMAKMDKDSIFNRFSFLSSDNDHRHSGYSKYDETQMDNGFRESHTSGDDNNNINKGKSVTPDGHPYSHETNSTHPLYSDSNELHHCSPTQNTLAAEEVRKPLNKHYCQKSENVTLAKNPTSTLNQSIYALLPLHCFSKITWKHAIYLASFVMLVISVILLFVHKNEVFPWFQFF